MFDLTGKTCLVVGAADRLGRGMSVALAEAGADVAVATLTPSQGSSVGRVADEIKTIGRRSHAVTLDVTSSAACDAAVGETIRTLGGLDVLVNNADVVFGKATSQTSDDEWARTLALNLTSVFFLCRAGGTALAERGGGKIVNVCSVNGERGMANSAAYCAAKAGVVNLTRALAAEWARAGVTVSGLGVGFLDGSAYAEDAANRNQLERYLPMRRLGEPDEIAPAIVYLASGAADFFTGQILYLEGGVLSHI